MDEKVRLAGRDWPVPVLSIKQNRIVVPAIFAFMPIFARIVMAMEMRDKNPTWFADIKLTTEDFDLMSGAIYAALTKGTPGLARNEFDNLEVSVEELFSALPIVAKQTGILKPPSPGDVPSGEADAGKPSTSTM